MPKKVLVTGGTGVAGRAIYALQGKYPMKCFVFAGSKDCDLTDKPKTLGFIESNNIDEIIHLAAISGSISMSAKHPATILRDNVLMSLNVLEAARMLKIEKVVMTLTTGMYPTSAENPIREGSIHEGPPSESNYGSSFAKRLIEPSIRAYREEYNLNVIGLVPNGIFGEDDNFSYEDAPLVPALIRRFYDNRNSSSEIVIRGDGKSLREYTYSSDIARAFIWCLNNYDSHEILNIGNTEEYSIEQIASMIAEFLNIDKKRIRFDMSKPQGVFRKSTSNSKFLGLFNFQYTPFKYGLERTVKWFCDNYPSIRTYSKV